MIIDMPTVSMGSSGSLITADRVAYDNSTSGLAATNVQDAMDEMAVKYAVGEEIPIGLVRENGVTKVLYRYTYVGTIPAVVESPSSTPIDIAIPITTPTKLYAIHSTFGTGAGSFFSTNVGIQNTFAIDENFNTMKVYYSSPNKISILNRNSGWVGQEITVNLEYTID